MIGTVLANKYEITEKVGGGGMANVYKARRLRDDRVVAIKALKPEFLEDEEFVARFKREAHAVSGLKHPSIVDTIDVGEENGVLWGVVNLNSVQLPEYGAIPWTIPAAAEEVGVIHTLCIRPSCSGRGYARQMVAFCEAEARRQGRTVIRLDTWEGNLPANRLYPSLGYRYAGTAEFFFMGFVRENLNCYEKAL